MTGPAHYLVQIKPAAEKEMDHTRLRALAGRGAIDRAQVEARHAVPIHLNRESRLKWRERIEE